MEKTDLYITLLPLSEDNKKFLGCLRHLLDDKYIKILDKSIERGRIYGGEETEVIYSILSVAKQCQDEVQSKILNSLSRLFKFSTGECCYTVDSLRIGLSRMIIEEHSRKKQWHCPQCGKRAFLRKFNHTDRTLELECYDCGISEVSYLTQKK
jgi:predicted RNA-binding Zn-ribbon protein involved in translation (DUF1610 family)